MAWSDAVLKGLKDNDVWLVADVPNKRNRDAQHFGQLFDRRFDACGPVLLAAKIDDTPGAAQIPRDSTLVRSRFMKGLGTGRGGALDA